MRRNRKGILLALIVPSLLVFAQLGVPEYLVVTDKARASVSVNISINSFYDDLADDGDWIWYRGRYVWVPEVAPRWRPYQYGHWVYTRRHGWYWVSDEPFGWAVYHYGRWAFHPEFGWYWVPGRRWAPAWVAWSHTDDDIGWAPLPPEYDDDAVSISVSINRLPVDYWNVVPITVFASTDVDRYIVRDRNYIHRVITMDEPETVVIHNNVVINNFIDVDVLEKKTKRDIVVYEERPAERPEAAGRQERNTIAVFNPEVKEEPGAKPRRLKKTEEVAKKKRALRALQEEQTTEPGGAPTLNSNTDEASPEEQDRRAKIRKKLQAQPEAQTEGKKRKKESVGELQLDEQSVQDQPSKKKKKRLLQEQEITSQSAEEPVKKRRKKSSEELQGSLSDQQPGGEPVKKRKKNAAQKSQQQMIEGVEEQTVRREKRAAQEKQEASQKKASQKQADKKNKKRACDPGVEDCSNIAD